MCARAAATGSMSVSATSSPAASPALVAWVLALVSNYAGTVMTARSIGTPSVA
ncbi:hypothetical protein ABZ412_34565 [Nocardia sp. NPDC005746]|uniref:hypothetical protein n=1 Tax=Nocardia sp. NPDC005746 TaxID=3157062 RepID=UPI0033FD9D6E